MPRKPRRPLLVKGECTPQEFAEWWWQHEPDRHPNNCDDRELMLISETRWEKPGSIRAAIGAVERTLLRQNPAFNREPLPPDVEEDFKEYRSILLERLDELISVDYARPPRLLSRRKRRRRSTAQKKPDVWTYFDAAVRRAQREARKAAWSSNDERADQVWNLLPDWVQASNTLVGLDSSNFLEDPDDLRDVVGPKWERRIKRELTAAWKDHLKKHPEAIVPEPEPVPVEEPDRAPPDRSKRDRRSKPGKSESFDAIAFLGDMIKRLRAETASGALSTRTYGPTNYVAVFEAMPLWLQQCESVAHLSYEELGRYPDEVFNEMEELDRTRYRQIRRDVTAAWKAEQERLQQGLIVQRVLARRKPQQEIADDHAARVARRRQAVESGGSS